MANVKKRDGKPPASRRKKGTSNSIIDARSEERTTPIEEQSADERGLKEELAVPPTYSEQEIVPRPTSYNLAVPPAPIDQKRGLPRSCTVTLRAPMQLVDDVDYWVTNRSYKSRSEFILASIRYYLDYLEYRESYNVRTFQRGQTGDVPSERFDRLRYLRGNP